MVGKYCFLYHRRLLEPSHKLRKDKVSFHGGVEMRPTPERLIGANILDQLQGCLTGYKIDNVRKRSRSDYEKSLVSMSLTGRKRVFFGGCHIE